MLKINYANTDLSRQQSRYEYTTTTVSLGAVEPLYVGFHKPISSLYIHVSDSGAEHETILEYYNGSAFVPVTGKYDLTFGLNRSGFISWSKGQANEAKITLHGEYLYWYRFNTSVPANVNLMGINTLFSDDFDLKGEYPTIMEHLPVGSTSFVKFHESARKTIVTDLRKTGITVQGISELKRKQLDAFDILDIEEVREASKFLALSKIFGWLSDQTGDKWENLKDDYAALAAGAITPLISIDTNNDGKADAEEIADSQPIIIGRL